jgi:hypothetical protein
MKMDVASDPIAITPLGTDGVMLDAHYFAALIQQLKLGIGDYFPENHVFWLGDAVLTLTGPRIAHKFYQQIKDFRNNRLNVLPANIKLA